jgi:hypothetical protein
MDFLQGVSLEQLFNCAESVKTFMEEENLPKPKKREHWTYLKKLINWATEPEYISNKPNFVDNSSTNFSFYKGEIQVTSQNLNLFGKQVMPKYALGCHYRDYITFALHKQVEDYRKFLIEERELCDKIKSSVAANLRITNLLLGWLHRHKNIPLDDLSLESIVPLIKTKLKLAETKTTNVVNKKTYLEDKNKFEEQARASSKETIYLVKSFLNTHSKVMSTRVNVLAAIINIAKFIYKNETNTKLAKNFEDIEIIELLRRLRSDEISNSKRVRVSRDTMPKMNIAAIKDKVGH